MRRSGLRRVSGAIVEVALMEALRAPPNRVDKGKGGTGGARPSPSHLVGADPGRAPTMTGRRRQD